jgi:NTP pyrophosphatase (non-canonical NTP hydrolase)
MSPHFKADIRSAQQALDRAGRAALELAERLPSKHETYLEDLAERIHPTNVDKGFWGPPEMMDKYVAKLALVHSEVSEILEALRKSQGSAAVTKEFSDVFIRALDLYFVLVEAGEAEPGLDTILFDKMVENENRPPKHGNRWG